MNLIRKRINIETSERTGFFDITDKVESLLENSSCGLIHIFIPHTTAALVISDKMDTVSHDISYLLERVFPQKDNNYIHRSPNSDAHGKSAVCGCELTVPYEKGTLLLGEWQRIYILEGDGPNNHRTLICTLLDDRK